MDKLRKVFDRWNAAKEANPKVLTFVHSGRYFQTWGEEAREANVAAGTTSYSLPNVGGVPFLSISEKYWEEDRDAILKAGYTINVI